MKCSTHNLLFLPVVLAMALFLSATCARAQIALGVVTLAAGNIVAVDTKASATLKGSVNPNGADTTAWFEWGNSTAYGNSTQPQNIGSGSSAVPIKAALTNLTPGFTHHYRCVASNSFGVGRGADQAFWSPVIMLNSPNPMTNECHVPFVDPSSVNAYPLAIAAGGFQCLAIKADGTVVGWGNNFSGQTNTPSSATNVVGIAAGWNHSMALKAGGTIVGWGNNDYGQTTIPASVTNVTAIAAGNGHSLALKADGRIVGWGNNGYGQITIPASATNVVAIAAGLVHSMALKADGTVISWGYNVNGQTNTPASATNVVAIAAGSYHNLALKADGTVVGWGDNNSGKATIPASVTNAIAIAAGSHHSMALKTGGTVISWGNNYTTATNVVAIAAGSSYSLALKADGTVIGWDIGGQITIPASVYQLNLPIGVSGTVDVDNPGTYVLTYSVTNALGAVATATRTVVVLPSPLVNTLPASSLLNGTATLNGSVIPWQADTTAWFEWGSARAYQNSTAVINIGDGTNVVAMSSGLTNLTPGFTYHYRYVASNSFGVGRGADQSFRSPALTFNGLNLVSNECHVPFVNLAATISGQPLAIAAGLNHSQVLKGDGTVVGWGDNFYGQTNTPASATNVVAIAAGDSHCLALKADGTIVGWGDNYYGQASIPASTTNVVAIVAGGYHNLALKADGKVIGWGNNDYGQTTIPASVTNVTAIAAGWNHSMALKADGTVICWGNNSAGQTSTLASATNVVGIAAGNGHSLALKADGRIVGWGNNGYGQITIPASATNVVAIAAGLVHSMALKADGTVISWGYNVNGQTNTPASATNVVAIAAGSYHNLALKADGTIVGWGFNLYRQTNIPDGLNSLNLPIAVNGTVDVNNPGTYVLNYSITNTFGTLATASRTVVVADALPPVLTLLGSNPQMHELGKPFSDPGVIATDLCAGDLIASVLTNLNVNPNIPLTYTNSYTVTDPSGHTTQTNRTVVVVTRPALTGLSHSSNGAFQFTFTNTPGARFNVLASTNVAQPLSDWTVLGPVTENSPGLFQFMDVTATNRPFRYYRLRWP